MNRLFLAATCFGCVLLAVVPTAVFANTLTVTNTASTGPGTLDDALNNANSGDTITFAVPLPATIVIHDGPDFIYPDINIVGPGANKLTISGDGTNNILYIDGATVKLSGLTFSNGVTSSDFVSYFDGGGGAIINFGTLTIFECAFKNNLSTGGQGHTTGGGGGGGAGGAIFNGEMNLEDNGPGILYVVNSLFVDNLAVGGTGDRFGGGGGGGFGGAIFNHSSFMALTNCTITANQAVGGSAGIAEDDDGSNGGGDGWDEPSGAEEGGSGSVGGGGGAGEPAEQFAGICDGDGGFAGGDGGFGGGAGVGGQGADGCEVDDVTNPLDGGNGGNGGDGGNGGFAGGGGGAGIGGNATGAGTLTGVLGSPGLGGMGAGSGVLTNGGAGAGFGGAIFTTTSGTTVIVNCTITSNSAVGGVSAGHLSDGTGVTGGVYNRAQTRVSGTIIAGNTADSDPDVGFTAANSNDFTSAGHNLIGVGDGSAAFVNGTNGDLVGSGAHPLNPDLGPLADNGGPTFTQSLLPVSPAINAGADVDCPETDQRGVTRPQLLHCDIGAFELDDTPPVVLCKNVVVSVVSNCSASASIDNGSFDSDPGDTITLSQSPQGPYLSGVTTVTLTATDHHGETNSCTATVTVTNDVLPTITCPSNIIVSANSPTGTVVFFSSPIVSGCNPIVTSSPVSGANFGIGDTTVTWTVASAGGLTNSCTFNVHVKSASESVTDDETLLQNLDIPPKVSKQIVRKLTSINKVIQHGRTIPACKQLLNLLRNAEHELSIGRLTEEQTISITTPVGQILTTLGCP